MLNKKNEKHETDIRKLKHILNKHNVCLYSAYLKLLTLQLLTDETADAQRAWLFYSVDGTEEFLNMGNWVHARFINNSNTTFKTPNTINYIFTIKLNL